MKTTAFVLVCVLICAVSLAGNPMKIATVKSPDINCKFDSDCKITVNDKATNFTLLGTKGSGFLQSRLWPKGEPGMIGANLYAYLYRIDVREPYGVPGKTPCITEFTIDFGGPVAALDYNGDGQLEQVFVTTQGGLGSVAPISANAFDPDGTKVTFRFSPGVCAGTVRKPGAGQSSFFIGMASKQAHRVVTATLKPSLGSTLSVAAWAPLVSSPPGKSAPPSRAPKKPGARKP